MGIFDFFKSKTTQEKMKSLFTVTIFAITSTLSYGQYTKTERTSKTIVQQRSIYLSGGLRASAGGKSRVVVPFDLPKNTVEWYYSFSTSEGTSGTKKLNLAIQLSSYLVDQTGMTRILLNQVKVPRGSSNVDVYLLNSANQTAFVEKRDNYGDSFYYISEGTTKNTKQAVVKVDDIKTGRLYLGLKNPSTLNGVNVDIEITTIIQNDVYVDEWTEENASKLKSACLGAFNTTASGQSEVCACLTEKITINNRPSVWNKKSMSSKERIAIAEMDACYSETGNTALKNTELEFVMQKNYKEAISAAQNHESYKRYEEAITSYEEALKIYTDEVSPKDRIIKLKKAIIDRDFDDAIRYGETNIGMENYEAALIQFEKAESLKPLEEYPQEKIKELHILIEKQRIERARVDRCVTRINKQVSDAKTSATINDYNDAQLKISQAIDSIINDKNVQKKYSNKQMSEIYNNAFWWSTLNKDMQSAGTFIKKVISSNSSGMNFNMNLAIYQLISGNHDKALKKFKKYRKRAKMPDGTKWIDAISERLNSLETNGFNNIDFIKLKSDLKIK